MLVLPAGVDRTHLRVLTPCSKGAFENFETILQRTCQRILQVFGIICIFDQEERLRLWMVQKAICGCENTRQSVCVSLLL